jgi:hypothetical protein
VREAVSKSTHPEKERRHVVHLAPIGVFQGLLGQAALLCLSSIYGADFRGVQALRSLGGHGSGCGAAATAPAVPDPPASGA